MQKRFAAAAAAATAALTARSSVAATTSQYGSSESAAYGARNVGDGAVGRELGQPLRELRREDRHGRLGLEQQRHAALGHDAAADDEDGAILEIREQG